MDTTTHNFRVIIKKQLFFIYVIILKDTKQTQPTKPPKRTPENPRYPVIWL